MDFDVPLIDDSDGILVGAAGVAPASVDTLGGGEALPAFTQGLMRLETGTVVSGRRLRGRFFLPGMQESFNTAAGVPSGTMVGDMNSAIGAFLGGDGGALVIYSPTHHVSFSVNDADFWTQWAILRSRRD